MSKGVIAATLTLIVAAFLSLAPARAMPISAPAALKSASDEINLTETVCWGCGYYRPRYYGYRPYYRPYGYGYGYGYRPYYRPYGYGYGYGYRPYYRPYGYGYGYGYRPYYRPYYSGYYGPGYYRPVPGWVSGPYYGPGYGY